MIASIRLLNGHTEVSGAGYARIDVDISQSAPTATFGPAGEDWGAATHIEAHGDDGILYRQTIVEGPVEFSEGVEQTLSLGSIQFGPAP